MAKSIDEIVAIKERVEEELLGKAGVTAVDVGYKEVGGERTDEIAIRVMVKKKKDVPAKEKVPPEIDGVKTDVIEREYELHTERMAVEDIVLQADTGTYDPLRGGISIGPCRVIGGFVYTGTLGCVVRDNVSGNRMLLSNFHVMCVDTGWAVGNTMAQPSRVDTGSCPADVVGTLQRAVLSANVDGAIASHDARGIQCSIEDIGSVTGSAAAALGTHVRKRGRTTGLTHGDIDSISLTVSVDYGDGIGVRTLTNQIGIAVDTSQSTEFGKKGDSGSVIVDDSRRVLGLYFAGSLDGTHGVANPIAAVLSELNISLCVPKRFEKFPKLEKLEFKEHKLEFKERFPDKLLLPEKWRTREKFWVEHKLVERPEIPDLPFDPRDPIGPGIGPRGAADDVGDKPQEAKLAETKAQDKLRDKPILADHKAYKEKHEKLEKFEKLEKIEKPERKELKHEKLEKEKLEKLEKPERKELKHEKLEWKELKHELKELKLEKLELEGPRKDLEIPGPDPYGPEQPGFDQWGMGGYGYGYGDEQHFIGEDLRPDLGEGALGGEEDLY